MQWFTTHLSTMVILLLAGLLLAGPSKADLPPDRRTPFQKEMNLVDKAAGNLERVKHLRKALELRPDHPENISVEFSLAEALSRLREDEGGGRPVRAEIIAIYDGILEKYDHKDYFGSNKSLSSTRGDMEMALPWTTLELLHRAAHPDKHRAMAFKALDEIKYTHDRRMKEWLEAPMPEEQPPGDLPVFRTRASASPQQIWTRQHDAALKGEVLNSGDLYLCTSLISAYKHSNYEKGPAAILLALNEIVARYPDTPIATIAQKLIKQEQDAMSATLTRDLDTSFRRMNLEPVTTPLPDAVTAAAMDQPVTGSDELTDNTATGDNKGEVADSEKPQAGAGVHWYGVLAALTFCVVGGYAMIRFKYRGVS